VNIKSLFLFGNNQGKYVISPLYSRRELLLPTFSYLRFASANLNYSNCIPPTTLIMSTLKAASRASRNLRVGSTLRQLRHESTNAPNFSSSSHTPSIVAGLAGGGLVFLGGYGWYHFSGKH